MSAFRMKTEYFWMKKVIECRANEQKHKPALKSLLKLYEERWASDPNINQPMFRLSLRSLEYALKQL